MVPQGPDLVVHQPDEVLDNMNEWCIKNHGKSGLTQKSRSSTVGLQEAEDQVPLPVMRLGFRVQGF